MTWIGLVLLILGASPYSVWQRVYDGGKVDMGHGVCLDSSGHVVVVGETNQASNYDCWMIALSRAGDSLWSLLYDDGHDEKGFSIATTHEGNIAVAIGTNQSAAQIDLYDPNGGLLWERRNSMWEVTKLITTADNNIYISGWSWDVSLGEYITHVYGYDGTGKFVLLINETTGNSVIAASDLAVDPLGYIYSGFFKSGPCAIWKNSPEGELVWFQEYGDYSTKAFALEMNEANHLFQAGDFASTNSDFLLLKWTAGGSLIWPEHKAYDLGANEYCRDLKLDSISDCYLAGWQDRGDEDVALVKTDSAGNMLWAWVDTLEGKQEIEGIEIDEEGYIYLAGSHYNGENWDMLVMKVRQPLTIEGDIYLTGLDFDASSKSDDKLVVSGDTSLEVPLDSFHYVIELYNGGHYIVTPVVSGYRFPDGPHEYSPLSHRMFEQNFVGYWIDAVEERPQAVLPELETSGSLIYFSLPKEQEGTLSIYSSSGQVMERMSVQGSGKVSFKSELASGVYFVRLETGNHSVSRKAVILE